MWVQGLVLTTNSAQRRAAIPPFSQRPKEWVQGSVLTTPIGYRTTCPPRIQTHNTSTCQTDNWVLQVKMQANGSTLLFDTIPVIVKPRGMAPMTQPKRVDFVATTTPRKEASGWPCAIYFYAILFIYCFLFYFISFDAKIKQNKTKQDRIAQNKTKQNKNKTNKQNKK